jgi:predicted AAA+ superfamily ATPase
VQTLAEACKPRDSIFDSTRRDTVLDLTDLVQGRIDPDAFFAENHITEGMRMLLTEAFRRLEGKSTQGVFKLAQAMGGGKTHNLLAAGLLAEHPELRAPVMGDFYTPGDIGPVRVVAFTGRESDAPYGIWGAIAAQLGKQEQFAPYYAPLSAPGQTAWVELLKGEPLLIMLDELPPYFQYAKAKPIGNSDLSVVTATALSNLLVAVTKDELANVCVIITDLTATYAEGSQQIVQALGDLDKETGRTAMSLEPVRMNTDELYQILRRRLFTELPPPAVIAEVAGAYAKSIKEARQMDVTNASPEQLAARIAASYPFHPAIRDLYARFKENPGFQQTRGLIRLMRIVAARLWHGGLHAQRYLTSARSIWSPSASPAGNWPRGWTSPHRRWHACWRAPAASAPRWRCACPRASAALPRAGS